MNIYINNENKINMFLKLNRENKIFKISEYESLNSDNPIMIIGNFDTIHYGHLTIIKKAVDLAKKLNKKTILYTMINHTKKYLNPISTIDEKLTFFENLGVDSIILEDFLDIKNIEAEIFIEEYLIKKYNISHLFCGFNFEFGKNKKGNVNYLRNYLGNYNIKIDISSPVLFKYENDKFDLIQTYELLKYQEMGYRTLSSTYIKEALQVLDITKINDLLAKPYTIIGKVVKGKQIGRLIGFRTANLLPDEKIYPKNGVYGVRVKIEGYEKSFYGVTNIGNNPTINNSSITIETNIFDFQDDIYDKIIYIELLEYIRSEKKFENITKLQEQIKCDTMYFKDIIKKEFNYGNI